MVYLYVVFIFARACFITKILEAYETFVTSWVRGWTIGPTTLSLFVDDVASDASWQNTLVFLLNYV